MAAESQKKVYNMSTEELKKMLQPVAETVLQKKWEKDGYITYHDESLCNGPDIMIHEYKDHRELVRIDSNGNVVLLKQLDHGNRDERTPSNGSYRRA